MVIPHLLHQAGHLVPVHHVAVAVQHSTLDLDTLFDVFGVFQLFLSVFFEGCPTTAAFQTILLSHQ